MGMGMVTGMNIGRRWYEDKDGSEVEGGMGIGIGNGGWG